MLSSNTRRTDFDELLAEQLDGPESKAGWDVLQPELAIAQAMIDARERSGMTQQKLSEMTGISQADISKLEHGVANPSIKTLQRLAAGLGMVLHIEFLPATQN